MDTGLPEHSDDEDDEGRADTFDADMAEVRRATKCRSPFVAFFLFFSLCLLSLAPDSPLTPHQRMPDPPVMPKLPPVSLDPEFFPVALVKKPRIKMSFAKLPPPPPAGTASMPGSGVPSAGASRASTPTSSRRPSKAAKPAKPKKPKSATPRPKSKVSREAQEAAALAAEAAAAYSRPTSGRAAARAAAKRVRAVATHVSDDEDDSDDLLPVKESPPPEPERAPIPSLVIRPPIRPPPAPAAAPVPAPAPARAPAAAPKAAAQEARSKDERQASKQAKRPSAINVKREELARVSAQSPGGSPAVGSPAIPTPLRLKISLKPPPPKDGAGPAGVTIKKGTWVRCGAARLSFGLLCAPSLPWFGVKCATAAPQFC